MTFRITWHIEDGASPEIVVARDYTDPQGRPEIERKLADAATREAIELGFVKGPGKLFYPLSRVRLLEVEII